MGRLRGAYLVSLFLLLGCGGGTTPHPEISTLVMPGTPDGTCLIQYNSGLVTPPADACCVRLGGPNSCDLSVQCNETTTGNPCCLFYATGATIGGQGCCRYSDGSTPTGPTGNDRTQQCDALINYGR